MATNLPSPEFESTAEPPPDSLINAEKAIAYWNDVPASLAGIMGGYPQIDRVDIIGSSNFLRKSLALARGYGGTLGRGTRTKDSTTKDQTQGLMRGVDCGAGIGRITKALLTNFCSIVDIVEPVKKFTDEITLGESFTAERAAGKIGEVYNVGLEDWEPQEEGIYTVIWNQWCLGHLTDKNLVAYLRRCIKGLCPGGIIVVKENLSTIDEDIYDEQDSSVTRCETKFRQIFQEAGLRILKNEIQRGFPASLGLYPVMSFALVPR